MNIQIEEIFSELYFKWSAQFHILKHFVAIDKAYAKQLVAHGYSLQQIDAQLKTIGSTFDTPFSDNPQELLYFLKNNKQYISTITQKEYTIEIQFEIMSNVEHGIGFDNLISLAQLTSNQRKTAYKSKIGDALLWHIDIALKRTNTINMVVAKHGDEYSIITIFPGTYAPPFPKIGKQSILEFDISSDFWNNHAFIAPVFKKHDI